MRKLTIDDVFTVSDMLSAVAVNSQDTFLKAANGKGDTMQLGVGILMGGYHVIKDDLKTWLASMCEQSVEEFANRDAVEIFAVVDELRNLPGAKDFFSAASRFVKPLTESSTSSSTDTGGQTKKSKA